jgi:hypothetical protein
MMRNSVRVRRSGVVVVVGGGSRVVPEEIGGMQGAIPDGPCVH